MRPRRRGPPLLRRARAEDCGSQSVELLIMVPILFWALFALYAFTDAVRTRAVVTDATAVIADALSRRTEPIDAADLAGLRAAAGQLSGFGGALGLRVTQLRCVEACEDAARRDLRGIFSRGDGMAPLGDGDFAARAARAATASSSSRPAPPISPLSAASSGTR